MKRLRAGVVYGFPFGEGGGIERTVCAIINALNRYHFEVTLVTSVAPQLPSLEKMYGFDLEVDSLYLTGALRNLPGFVRGAVATLKMAINTLRASRDLDLVLCIGGLVPRFVPFSRQKVICYMLAPRQDPVPEVLADRNLGFFGRILSLFWRNAWPGITGPSKKHFLLVHNNFAGRLLKRDFGLEHKHVLGVPVSEETFTSGGKRLNQMVHLARFSPEKRHEVALEIFEDLLRSRRDIVLYLVGQANQGAVSEKIMADIRDEISSKALQSMVFLLQGPSHHEVWDLLRRSKIVMSMQTEPETYNTTILEGMAAGCIPLVPDSERGAWDDILDYGRYGKGFAHIEDASDSIAGIMNLSEEEFAEQSRRCMVRAQEFSQGAFSRRLMEFAREVWSISD